MRRTEPQPKILALAGWIAALALAIIPGGWLFAEDSDGAEADPQVKKRSLAANEQFDQKFGLILPNWQISKIRSRLSPSNSDNLRLGLPPFRQQPEGMEQHPRIEVLQPPRSVPVSPSPKKSSGPAPQGAPDPIPAVPVPPPPNPNQNP